MRGFLQKEFRNIVFIVLVVAAALTIYLLSRAEGTQAEASSSAETTAAAEDTSEATEDASAATEETTPAQAEDPVFSGVPEEVLLTHLLTAEAFTAEPAKDGDRAWILSVGESPAVEARFAYTVERGAVAGFELTMALPVQTSAKSKSEIDQYLSANSDEMAAARTDALRTFLTDLVASCDADDAISETTVRLWAQKAAVLDKAGDSYSDSAGGGSFVAFVEQESDGLTLVCSLDAPD